MKGRNVMYEQECGHVLYQYTSSNKKQGTLQDWKLEQGFEHTYCHYSPECKYKRILHAYAVMWVF